MLMFLAYQTLTSALQQLLYCHKCAAAHSEYDLLNYLIKITVFTVWVTMGN